MATSRSIRAGAAYVELFVKDNRLVKGLKSAQMKLASFGASIKSIGVKLLALGGGVAAPLLASLKVFGSFGRAASPMPPRCSAGGPAIAWSSATGKRSFAMPITCGRWATATVAGTR